MQHVARHIIAAGVISLTLVGCRDATAPQRTTGPLGAGPMMSREGDPSAPLVLHVVKPSDTDPNIDYVPPVNPLQNDHYVFLDTTARGNSKLLVFMPGNKNAPVSWQQYFLPAAARLGYHVIGLMYQNDTTVIQVCLNSPDPDCSGNIHLEVQDGIDRSTLVNVTPANGIDNRLIKVLVYLDARFPDEGWSRFLKEGEPNWSQIVVAGQSQGAAQAALIGQLHHVARVAMFSGPPDGRLPDEADRWVFIGATPADKYFALFHDRDHTIVGIRWNLAALDLWQFGAPVLAEENAPPYGGSHMIYTDLRPTLGYDALNAPHQSTARDNNTPIGPDGVPLLRDAWRYLLGFGSDADDVADADVGQDR